MKLKTVTLDPATRDILLRSRIDGKTLTLPGQLAREDYLRVAKAIEAAGGKWNRKAQCHVFPEDVRQTLNIDQQTVAVVNVQQTYQAFYTPPALAKRMVELASIQSGMPCLEPSAGMGAIVKEIVDSVDTEILAYEIDPKKVAHLDKTFPGYRLQTRCRDFLTVTEGQGFFERVLMNPPFTGGQDIEHTLHALKFLRSGGRLVGICANGSKQREKLMPLVEMLDGQWEDLPLNTFKESGTGVNTAMIVINA